MRKIQHIGIVIAATLVAAASPSVAQARPADERRVVSTTQASWTPVVDVGTFGDGSDRQVWSFARTAGTIYTCGKFGRVQTQHDGTWHERASVFAFRLTGANRGRVTAFAPTVKQGNAMGTVHKCIIGFGGGSLLLAGEFTSVNGRPAQNLALVDRLTGQVVPFQGTTDGKVTDVQGANGRYFLYGSFTKVNGRSQVGIATLSRTGAFDPYFRSRLRGAISPQAGPTKAYRGAISPSRKEMVAIVNTSSIDGKRRRHLAKWNLGQTGVTLQRWVPRKAYDSNCQINMVVRDVGYQRETISGTRRTYFYTVATGGGRFTGLCDQTIKWNASARGVDLRPVWRNRTCADTLHALALDGRTIYASGHQKCTEARVGGPQDNVRRMGIHALRTVTGNARVWRSDQPRCVGGKDLLIVPKVGLLAGTDCGRGIYFRSY